MSAGLYVSFVNGKTHCAPSSKVAMLHSTYHTSHAGGFERVARAAPDRPPAQPIHAPLVDDILSLFDKKEKERQKRRRSPDSRSESSAEKKMHS